MANPKRPKDTNERAKLIVDLLTGQAQEPDPNEGKNPAAVELGRLGGKARATKLSAKKRKEIAQQGGKKTVGNPKYLTFTCSKIDTFGLSSAQ